MANALSTLWNKYRSTKMATGFSCARGRREEGQIWKHTQSMVCFVVVKIHYKCQKRSSDFSHVLTQKFIISGYS